MQRLRSSTLSTRVLLICGTLASVHALLHFATVAWLTLLAPASPPLYALVASVHGLTPFLARRITRAPGSATITAGIAGVIVSATSPSGLILLVPLLATGLTIDLVVGRSDTYSSFARRSERRFVLAAALLGVILFALSLIVFSPEHVTPALLVGTFISRILGEVVVAVASGYIARALYRAGVGRSQVESHPPPRRNAPST